MKKCNKCGEDKDLGGFYVKNKLTGQLRATCRSCVNEKARNDYHEKMKDPEFNEKLNLRNRVRYHKNNRRSRQFKVSDDFRAIPMTRQEAIKSKNDRNKEFKSKFPDKIKQSQADYRKRNPDKLRKRQEDQNARFPEKYLALNATRSMNKPHGMHLHHWSYLKEHRKDVIPLTVRDHVILHKNMIYDPERMQYRRIDTMELLDTKESHINYINLITNES